MEKLAIGLILFLVGILDWFKTDYPASYMTGEVGLRSPFLPASSHLAVVTAPNLPDGAVTVGKAMAVPPVARAIALYSTVIASFDLAAAEGTAPTWCTQTTGAATTGNPFASAAITPAHRWALMLQDLVFFNETLLWKDDVDGEYRPVNGLSHVPHDRWNLDKDGFVLIDGAKQDSRHLVYVRGILPAGFLEAGKTSINHYHQLLDAILHRARNPVPLLDLHINDANFQPAPAVLDEDGNVLVEGEMEEIARKWAQARSSTNGAAAVSPAWLDVKALGTGAMDMLTDARNAARLEIAGHLNINASLLEGNNGTSDTYSNTLQNRNELLDLSIRTFLRPIEARLSQDDVTAPGTRLAFDTSAFDTTTDAKGNTGTAVAPPAEQETPDA